MPVPTNPLPPTFLSHSAEERRRVLRERAINDRASDQHESVADAIFNDYVRYLAGTPDTHPNMSRPAPPPRRRDPPPRPRSVEPHTYMVELNRETPRAPPNDRQVPRVPPTDVTHRAYQSRVELPTHWRLGQAELERHQARVQEMYLRHRVPPSEQYTNGLPTTPTDPIINRLRTALLELDSNLAQGQLLIRRCANLIDSLAPT